MLWVLMLAFPFPYIAVIAGWITTELGRQPWLVYGLFRTAQGSSPTVHAGHGALHAASGFCGLYLVLGVLFLFLIAREIGHGPSPEPDRGRPMPELWYAIAVLMLTAYVVLDGFDLGAGALHLFVARSDSERRQVLAAIGPYWDGNEVWLLAAGGVLFVGVPENPLLRNLGLLFRDLPRTLVPHPAGDRDRIPEPRDTTRSGAGPGISASRSRAPFSPSSSAPLSET